MAEPNSKEGRRKTLLFISIVLVLALAGVLLIWSSVSSTRSSLSYKKLIPQGPTEAKRIPTVGEGFGCRFDIEEKKDVGGVLVAPPFVLQQAKGYRDGGTTAFIFTDAQANKLAFCFDCQINSKTWGQFYLNVMHARESGGMLVPINSHREKELVCLLREWIDSRYSIDDQARLAKESYGGKDHKAKIILWFLKNLARRDDMRRQLNRPSDSAPLINTAAIPEDGQSYTQAPKYAPSIFVGADKLYYQDGQAGPLRVFDCKNLSPLWSWPAPRKYPTYYLSKIIRNFPVFIEDEYPSNHLYEWDIGLWGVYQDILVTKESNPKNSLNFVCGLDVNNGKIKWKTRGYGQTYPNQHLIVEGLGIVVGWAKVQAYSLESGQLRWSTEYSYQKQEISGHTMNKTLMTKLAGDMSLLWGIDDKIYSIDAATGQMLWMTVPTPGLKPAVLCDGDQGFGNRIARPEGNIVYFCHKARRTPSILIAFDVNKRIAVWEYRNDDITAFVQDKNDVFVASWGPIRERGIVCLDANTGEQKWISGLPRSYISGLAVTDRIVYCCDRKLLTENEGSSPWKSNLYAIDRLTGKIMWRYSKDEYFIGNPIPYKDKVYLLSTKAERDHNAIVRIFRNES